MGDCKTNIEALIMGGASRWLRLLGGSLMGFFTGDPAVYLIAVGAAVKIHHGPDQGAEPSTGSTPLEDP